MVEHCKFLLNIQYYKVRYANGIFYIDYVRIDSCAYQETAVRGLFVLNLPPPIWRGGTLDTENYWACLSSSIIGGTSVPSKLLPPSAIPPTPPIPKVIGTETARIREGCLQWWEQR